MTDIDPDIFHHFTEALILKTYSPSESYDINDLSSILNNITALVVVDDAIDFNGGEDKIIDLTYQISFKKIEKNENNFKILLSVIRFLIGSVSEIRKFYPNHSIGVYSKLETEIAVSGIAEEIDKFYNYFLTKNEVYLFDNIFGEFMQKESKIDKGHRAAKIYNDNLGSVEMVRKGVLKRMVDLKKEIEKEIELLIDKEIEELVTDTEGSNPIRQLFFGEKEKESVRINTNVNVISNHILHHEKLIMSFLDTEYDILKNTVLKYLVFKNVNSIKYNHASFVTHYTSIIIQDL